MIYAIYSIVAHCYDDKRVKDDLMWIQPKLNNLKQKQKSV